MRVLIPVPITLARLVSTTVAMPTTTAAGDGVGAVMWSAVSTYARGARVISPNNLRLYESVADANTNKVPENNTATEPQWWVDLGNCNRWRMLRLDANKRTVAPSPLVVEIAPGKRVSAVGLPHVDADQVLIEQYTAAGALIGSWTRELVGREVNNWLDYFTAEWRPVTTTVVDDLHMISDSRIKLTFTKATGDVSVGPIVIGNVVDLGETQLGAQVGGKSFSIVKENAFGDRDFIKRRLVPVTSQQTFCDGLDLDHMRQALTDLDGDIALWIGVEDPSHWYFSSLLVLGFTRRWDFGLDHNGYDILNLDIEGL